MEEYGLCLFIFHFHSCLYSGIHLYPPSLYSLFSRLVARLISTPLLFFSSFVRFLSFFSLLPFFLLLFPCRLHISFSLSLLRLYSFLFLLALLLLLSLSLFPSFSPPGSLSSPAFILSLSPSPCRFSLPSRYQVSPSLSILLGPGVGVGGGGGLLTGVTILWAYRFFLITFTPLGLSLSLSRLLPVSLAPSSPYQSLPCSFCAWSWGVFFSAGHLPYLLLCVFRMVFFSSCGVFSSIPAGPPPSRRAPLLGGGSLSPHVALSFISS